MIAAVWPACLLAQGAGPQQVLDRARAWVNELRQGVAQATRDMELLCRQADEEDDRLADVRQASLADLPGMAAKAQKARESCNDATQLLASRSNGLDAARARLRQVASDIHLCGAGSGSCTANRPEAMALTEPSTATRSAMRLDPAPPRVAITADPATRSAQPLLTRAAGAQERVAQVKGLVADAYARADTAASLALGHAEQAGPAVAVNEIRAAREAVVAAADARRAATQAQRASNDWVGASLALAECRAGGQDCADALQRSTAAEGTLQGHIDLAKKRYETTRLASYSIEAATQFGSPDQRADAVRLLRTLDEYPDARGLFGPESYRLSASTAGAQASIKLVFGRRGAASQGQTSLIVSTPAADRGNTTLYSSADGLAAATTLELGHARIGGFGRAGDFFTGLKAWGLSMRVGHEKREFYELGDLVQSRTRNLVPWALNAYGAYAGLQSPVMALFRFSLQSAYDDQPPSITCPLPIDGDSTKFGCLNASIGAPSVSFARVYSLELRQTGGGPSVAAMLSYNDRKRVTDLTVPIYLLRNGDDQTGSTYNAGIQLGWSSKSGGSIGVFVGAPFSLLSLD